MTHPRPDTGPRHDISTTYHRAHYNPHAPSRSTTHFNTTIADHNDIRLSADALTT